KVRDKTWDGSPFWSEADFGLEPELFGIDAKQVRTVFGVFRQHSDRADLEPEQGVPLAAVVDAAEIAVETVIGHCDPEARDRLDLGQGLARRDVEILDPARGRGQEHVGPAVEGVKRG